ncbi:hypothetical protein SAMN05421812_102190 [Asanoa hainanensis]|uniref:Uncharacterized protein n=1 Tax=Asanoa hainanensis TaxID=560556 RepID=A0A239I6W1_9ACTN|nr:hypothetical protein [Asanoa hainanensis]SNS88074.1 hypothetical protein SAMN05421812_102190 [Asanoa hainanensis]
MTGLERRYRRLLALFPSRHRQAYEAEMLAALLAGAREGQTRPRAGEVVDLARAALTAHLGLIISATFSFLVFGVAHLPIAVVAALLTVGCLAVWAATDGPVFRGPALWPALGAGVIGAGTGWLPRAPFSGTVPWLPVGGQWQYEAGTLGVAVVAVTTVLLAATVLMLPSPIRARVAVLALPVVGLAMLHNAGVSYPSTVVVLCLLVVPFVGIALSRSRRWARLPKEPDPSLPGAGKP